MKSTNGYFRPEVLSKIARLELRAQHVVEGFVSGLHKSPYKGFSVEFADHREYTPGDDTRHIDWRVYAKADRYYIKEYEVETNLRTYLLLDCSKSMAYPEHPGTGRMTKWEYGATVAASLAHLLVYQQDGAGLMLFDSEVRDHLPVSANRASLASLAAVIERNAPERRTELKTLLPHIAERIPHRSLVVLISDLLTDVNDVLAGLQRFRFGRHDVLVLHVLDHDELEFPFSDRTLFEGMEQVGVEVMTDPQSLRRAYLEAVQGFISKIRSACLNHKVDYALLSTADPLDIALTRYLANRMHRLRSKA
ncbi:MAG TPA: DUF58 domain-containing protein [Phycisphaerae bacterium]|jgi:uncharacterized protein (DUF58 family)